MPRPAVESMSGPLQRGVEPFHDEAIVLSLGVPDLEATLREAAATYREAAAAGDTGALRAVAGWLRERPGREADADRIHRYGLDAHGRTVGAGPH